MALTTDTDIVDMLREGQEEGYRYLFQRHYAPLCAIAYEYVRDDFVVETIVTDVFFHVWQIRQRLIVHTSLRNYLAVGVRRHCLDWLREQQRRRLVPATEATAEQAADDSYPLARLLDGELEVFNKPLPSSIGFSNIMVNAGKVRNSGIDLVLNSVNIDNKDLQWETALNVSYLKNKVIKLPDYIPQLITGSMASFVSDFNITRVGDPIYSFYGYKVDGIFQQEDDVAKSGQPNAKPGDLKFHDESGDGKITSDDRTILGKPFPDVTFGLTNTLRWKGFTLSVFLQGVFGISMLDINVMESFYPTNEYRNRIAKYYRHRWTADNPSNEYPSGVNSTDYGGQFCVNSKTVVDASFLRVKNISLSYDIPLRSHRIFQGLQAYAAIDNLVTFTSYDGYDPDASATGANAVSKVAYNSYPLARTVRLGVNLTF